MEHKLQPVLNDVADMLDTVTSALETMMAAYEHLLPMHSKLERETLIEKAREVTRAFGYPR
jgi:hypothetical protein